MLFTKKRIYSRREKAGSNLKLKPHEKVILDHIKGTMRLDKQAKEVYRSLGSLKKYASDYLRQPLYEQGYLRTEERKRLLFIPQTKFVLAEKGLEAQRRIESLLADGDNLEGWVESDPGRAKAYLSVCSPNVLLLEQYDLKAIEVWARVLAKEESKPYDHYDHLWYCHFRYRYLLNDDNGHLPSEQLGAPDYGDSHLGFDFEDLDFDVLDNFDSFSDSLTLHLTVI